MQISMHAQKIHLPGRFRLSTISAQRLKQKHEKLSKDDGL